MIKYRAASAPVLFPLFEAFPVTGPVVSILFFFNYALLITSRASNFLMTLNRFTVMQLSARLYERVRIMVFIKSTVQFVRCYIHVNIFCIPKYKFSCGNTCCPSLLSQCASWPQGSTLPY